MKIAYIASDTPDLNNRVLAELAQALEAKGRQICACVQHNTHQIGRKHCDMDVKIIPNGPIVRISQNLGEAARGCRLDMGALETAVVAIEERLNPKHFTLIINKFGKHEAEGRGFRNVIAQALSMDIPVILAVNALNREAFLEFAGAFAEAIEPDFDKLMKWLEEVRALCA